MAKLESVCWLACLATQFLNGAEQSCEIQGHKAKLMCCAGLQGHTEASGSLLWAHERVLEAAGMRHRGAPEPPRVPLHAVTAKVLPTDEE